MKATTSVRRNISIGTTSVRGNSVVSRSLSKKQIVSFTNTPLGNVTINISGGADKHYEHNQGTAVTIWDIQHNLDKIPSVSVIDSAGDTWMVEPEHLSKNRLTITFPAAMTGKAYLN